VSRESGHISVIVVAQRKEGRKEGRRKEGTYVLALLTSFALKAQN
jgi:hypothetical protein